MITENYLQPTGFKLILNSKHYKTTEFMVNEVNHPDVTLPGVEVPYKSVNTHSAGERLVFGEVTFQMVVDEDLKNYTEMYHILKDTVQEAKQVRTDRLITKKPLDFDITLITLTSKNNLNKKIVYKDARLTSLGAINMQANTPAITYILAPLTFEFSYFDIV